MNAQYEIMLRLLLAVLLGGLLGLEREFHKKSAGLRTYALVSLGAAFFTIISLEAYKVSINLPGIAFDPARIIGQIVLGIGFLGGGLIVLRDYQVEGLTTAAGIWVAAAIGGAVGMGFYFPAFFVTFLAVGILSALRMLELKMFDKKDGK